MAIYGRLNIGSTAVDFFFKREYFHLMSLNILTRIIHSHDVQWNKLQNLRYRHFRSMKSVSFCIHPHSHPPHLFIHFTSYMTAQLTLLNNRREEKKKKKNSAFLISLFYMWCLFVTLWIMPMFIRAPPARERTASNTAASSGLTLTALASSQSWTHPCVLQTAVRATNLPSTSLRLHCPHTVSGSGE